MPAKEISINSFEEFFTFCNNHCEGMYYRGVSKSNFSLIPSIGRLLKNNNEDLILRLEQSIYSKFKREFTAIANGLSPIDIAINAQHHGLPGRLLDWTLNPLIALFFAVSSHSTEECAIYVLSPDNIQHAIPNFNYEAIFITLDTATTEEFYNGTFSKLSLGDHYRYMKWLNDADKFPRLYAFSPLAANRRVSLQSGIFTMQINPFEDLLSDIISFKVLIPAKAKKNLTKQLRMFNVNEYTVFGDPDHLTAWLRRECDSTLS